ncbi:MAG: hypothetical protein AAGJ80_04955, partial [Cyanobacteria bacterium J06553_1]
DSDWEEEDSDDDTDYRQPQDLDSDTDSDTDMDEELDYVSPHDSSMDSDTPLSVYRDSFVQEKVADGAPGTDDFQWSEEKEENFAKRYGFSGTPGVKVAHLSANSTPREFFDCFFTPNLWKTMKLETNRYAAQHPPKDSGHMKTWVDVDEKELQTYLGLRLLMGVKPLPSYRDYWSTRASLGDSFVKKTMPRDRFDAITSHLHFTNNEDQGLAGDRLRKLRPVVDVLAKTFKTVYVPEKEVTVDESLFRYRGRFHAIQFNPSKRARFGLKAYKLCQSCGPAAGYTCAMRMYMGADRSEMPASYQAVVNLMGDAGLFDKGYQLFTDNWYSSPTLFHYLHNRKTNAVGTVRTTRKFMPTDLQVRKKGDMDYRSSTTGQLGLAWHDRKIVYMLSTMHRGPETVTLPPNHRGERRLKPLVVVEYNDGMKGVDLSDQRATSYATPRKARKWYHNLFFHLVDTVVVNAYLVHRVSGGKKTSKDFRLDLAEDLLQQPRPATRAERAQARQDAALAAEDDLPVPTPSIPEGHVLVQHDKYRRCKACKEAGRRRKETRFHCSVCDVGLCAGECFNSYHH